jgi:hypothetical protein
MVAHIFYPTNLSLESYVMVITLFLIMCYLVGLYYSLVIIQIIKKPRNHSTLPLIITATLLVCFKIDLRIP